MTRLIRWLLSAWRTLWLGTLKLFALPWLWLARRLGARAQADAEASPSQSAAAKAGAEAPARAEPGAKTAEGTAESIPEDIPDDITANIVEDAAATESSAAEHAAPRKSAPRRGRFADGVFRNDTGQRDYKLYVPAGKPEGLLPLVVMLHGCKQDPDDFAAGTQMNRLADRTPMLVLYPAQTRSANAYGCWNWFNRHDQQRDAGEPSMIAGMIQEVLAKHPVDPKRVYVAGLSAGGAMATILAHTYPELLAAAGVHSGLPYAAAQDMITALGVMKRGPPKRAAATKSKPPIKPSAKEAAVKAAVPLIVFHGDHDKTVHPLNGERVVEEALEAARAAKPHDHGHPVVKAGRVAGGHAYTRTLHADREGRVQVEHWVVQGSGHAWSGGDKDGSFTDPLGPDASAEMLRFFLERTRA